MVRTLGQAVSLGVICVGIGMIYLPLGLIACGIAGLNFALGVSLLPKNVDVDDDDEST